MWEGFLPAFTILVPDFGSDLKSINLQQHQVRLTLKERVSYSNYLVTS